jgi:hypothetical protein
MVSILNFASLGWFLPYINKYSRTCSFQMLVSFTCHYIIHSIWRVDKLNASIFKLAAYQNCKYFCTYLYITIWLICAGKVNLISKEASILLACRLTTSMFTEQIPTRMFTEQIPTRTQSFWISFDQRS